MKAQATNAKCGSSCSAACDGSTSQSSFVELLLPSAARSELVVGGLFPLLARPLVRLVVSAGSPQNAISLSLALGARAGDGSEAQLMNWRTRCASLCLMIAIGQARTRDSVNLELAPSLGARVLRLRNGRRRRTDNGKEAAGSNLTTPRGAVEEVALGRRRRRRAGAAREPCQSSRGRRVLRLCAIAPVQVAPPPCTAHNQLPIHKAATTITLHLRERRVQL